MKKIFRFRTRYLVVLLSVLMFSAGYVFSPNDNYFEISKNLDIFGKLYREVNTFYVDDVDPNQFMRVGIDAMLESLDPYTVFISASEIEEYKFISTGQYGGIGAVISKRNGQIIISEPYEGYPAAIAGLKAGDVIIKIDDEVLTDKDIETLDVRNLLRGQPKSRVKLTVERMGIEQPIEVEIIRDEIKILNVPYYGMVDDKTGYIALKGFTKGASKEVKHALEDLKKENPNMEGVILDLRDNPGGLLFEAIDIANIFVPQGEKIVETRGKIEGSLNIYKAEKAPVDTDIRIAVLANGRSASASEIVSGVIQDLDRGVVVGQRTFGKGLVQTTRQLSYNTQLKITTAKYYTPSGRCIQAIDYSHRNADGSVAKVPDSLKKEFKTRNGRTVYDGGGVEPDVEVGLPTYHIVTRELAAQSLLFDYATYFYSKNPTIPDPREFEVTDKIYKDFVTFVKGKSFSYETKTEKELTRLKEMMQEEAYYQEVEDDVEHIKKELASQKDGDLMKYKKEITPLLKYEIVNRYYYAKGEVEASFDMDPEVLSAAELLQDKERYEKILSGK